MNLHQTRTEFNCGIDLHKKSMYVCVMDRSGKILLHRRVRSNDLEYFLKLIAPYAADLTICCESTYNWYFLYDFCCLHGFEFVLGHAVMIRAISQSKRKNDRADSQTLADLLRSNLLPAGFSCPKAMRDVRDLLRRRLRFVRQRASQKNFLTTSVHAQGYAWLTNTDKGKRNRREALHSRADSEMIMLAYDSSLDMIEAYDAVIGKIEKRLVSHTWQVESELFACLHSFPAIGNISALTLLYEIADINRFRNVKHFCSYCRVVFPQAESDGKALGCRGAKQGNAYLKWAFSEIITLAPSKSPSIKRYYEHLERKHDTRTAKNILAHRFASAVYYCLKRRVHFSLDAFFNGKKSFIDPQEQSELAEAQAIPGSRLEPTSPKL